MSTDPHGWLPFQWQLLRGGPMEPAMHMALDEVLVYEVASGRRLPTLRIWEWASSAVVIGCFQSVRNEIDAEEAGRHGITVVRRISGGGAMFIEPGNTITYSIYAPESLVTGMSFIDSFAFLDTWLIDALATLEVNAWYVPINDITSTGGKIGGAAQARRAGAVLHHVTIAYDIDSAKMMQVLRIGREKLSDKAQTSAVKRVDPVRRQTGVTRAAVIDRMVETFGAQHGLNPSTLTAEEIQAARDLVESKFGTDAWLYQLA
ncbi:MAG: lipoate--protein ligase family protein [Chloroflexota bacterium]